ncbi:MAG: CSLREA domain-containing protein [Candidatus Aminicenantes bacterium]|nr:CSLREA domain-containing protein [Candidatus Aminicenantes bacterium]
MEIQKKSPKRDKKLQVFLLLTGIMFLGGFYLQGVTFTVNTTGDTVDVSPGDGTAADSGGNCSLRTAIMEANALAGTDTIIVPAGTYKLAISGADEDNCASGDLDIRSDLTIHGAGKNATIIDGDELDRVFHIKGEWTVTITNLTVQNGKAPDGEDVTSSSSLQARGIPRQPAVDILSSRDKPPRRRQQTSEHRAGQKKFSWTAAATAGDGDSGGGILNINATLTIKNCKILNNRTGRGGSDWVEDENYSSGDGGSGGGLYNLEGTVTISNSEVKDNITGDGGCYPGYYECWCRDGGDGGGLYNKGGSMTLTGCAIEDNRTGNTGDHGSGGDGGGLCSYNTTENRGTLTLIGCTIKGNSTGDGGYMEGGGGYGGGIANGGGATTYIRNCLIYQNRCGFGGWGDSGSGGGIANGGALYVANSTISANRTFVFGGGLFSSGDLAILLESCTVTGNEHSDICNGWPDFWYLGITQTCVLKVHNTISSVCCGEITSLGYNLIEKACSAPSYFYYCDIIGDTSNDIIGVNPKLGALVDNGGPTKTHALLKRSPCLDAGDPDDYETTDQRGVLRPKDGDGDGTPLPDIGAYEEFTPQIDITTPSAGAKVSCTVLLEAEANTRYVDFKIDGVLLQTVDGAPHTCSWDTSAHANGSHTIKAVCYDSPGGFTVQDQITVEVDNSIIALTVPSAGANICGTILLEAEANTRYVDFYIDDTLLQTVDGAPHTCEWDTSVHANGSHTIKVVGSDTPGGCTVQDQITVKVDNTIIALTVSPYEESAWLIAKYYGHVTFTIPHIGQTAPTAYQIERKEAGGTTFNIVKEVTGAEMADASYTCYDPLPNNTNSYTYRVTAVDSSGVNVGRSDEQTI